MSDSQEVVSLPELPEPFSPKDAAEVFDLVGGNMCGVELVHPMDENQIRPKQFNENDLYTLSAHDIASVLDWAEVFTADQMREYARQAVLMERERWQGLYKAAVLARDYHRGMAAICRTELSGHDAALEDAIDALRSGK